MGVVATFILVAWRSIVTFNEIVNLFQLSWSCWTEFSLFNRGVNDVMKYFMKWILNWLIHHVIATNIRLNFNRISIWIVKGAICFEGFQHNSNQFRKKKMMINWMFRFSFPPLFRMIWNFHRQFFWQFRFEGPMKNPSVPPEADAVRFVLLSLQWLNSP